MYFSPHSRLSVYKSRSVCKSLSVHESFSVHQKSSNLFKSRFGPTKIGVGTTTLENLEPFFIPKRLLQIGDVWKQSASFTVLAQIMTEVWGY